MREFEGYSNFGPLLAATSVRSGVVILLSIIASNFAMLSSLTIISLKNRALVGLLLYFFSFVYVLVMCSDVWCLFLSYIVFGLLCPGPHQN